VAPFERLPVAEAFGRHAGIDLLACDGKVERLREAARAAGHGPGAPGDSFDDLFFRLFLERIEPAIGLLRPTYLVDWPAPMAALARVKASDPRLAERFELYAGGLELANAFGELTDAAEQERRLREDQTARRRAGATVYPLDERFLDALREGIPPAAGIALGVDRLLMLLLGRDRIDEVLAFPFGC
jgi:lysyl-tRNA synthetase class 2